MIWKIDTKMLKIKWRRRSRDKILWRHLSYELLNEQNCCHRNSLWFTVRKSKTLIVTSQYNKKWHKFFEWHLKHTILDQGGNKHRNNKNRKFEKFQSNPLIPKSFMLVNNVMWPRFPVSRIFCKMPAAKWLFKQIYILSIRHCARTTIFWKSIKFFYNTLVYVSPIFKATTLQNIKSPLDSTVTAGTYHIKDQQG